VSAIASQALVYQKLPATLPSGCVAAPIVPSTGPVRLCVVVRTSAPLGSSGTGTRLLAGPGGPYIPLRETYDASVVLGCIADARGRVQQWLEIWIQNFDTSSPRMSTAKEVLNNAVLDRRWTSRCERFAEQSPLGIVRTGFEDVHPEPTLIDLRRGVAMRAVDPRTGKAWALCEDDGLLTSKNLPAYGTTLHRYLYQPEADATSPLVALTEGAPSPSGGTAAADLREAMGVSTEVVVFNPGGGLLMVTPHAPVGLESYIQSLTLLGTEDGSISMLQTASRAASRVVENAGGAGDEAGMLFLSRHGNTGRVLETLYHKLSLLCEATAAVRATTAATQEPLLNITAQSFRMHLSAGSAALPFLWSSRLMLAVPGCAVALPVKMTDRKLYGVLEETRGVYNPTSSSRAAGGAWGELRIRRVQLQDEMMILEGTLTTQERVTASGRDSVWMRFGTGAGRVDLYATLEGRSAMAAGELRVRSVPMKLPAEIVAELKASEGAQIPEVFFEVAPLLSTPSDLYALMVLGVRALLVNGDSSVAVALDEFLSLSRQVSADYDAGKPLAERVRAVFAADERFIDALGPHRVSSVKLTPAQAMEIVPLSLWSEVLAALVRAAPGIGPDSTCRDLGDAPAAAIEKAFDPLLGDLYALVRKVRSMIVSDPAADAELHDIVRMCM